MSYCDKSNCGYYYKGDDDDFACCHCPDDMTAPCEYDDETETDDVCPLGGDITDDCADCVYSGDYHFVNGECKRRNNYA